MSWFSRITAVGSIAFLAACGFQPLYGQRHGTSTQEGLAAVHINPIADRGGQILYNYLLDGMNPLGPPSSPDYDLKIKLTEEAKGLALRSDQTATRVNLTQTASFTLTPAGEKKPALSGVSHVITSYNVLSSPYATLISEEDARARGLRDVAREIQTRVAVFLTRRAQAE